MILFKRLNSFNLAHLFLTSLCALSCESADHNDLDPTGGSMAIEAGASLMGDMSAGEAAGEAAGETSGEAAGETSGEAAGETSGEAAGETSGEAAGETSGESAGEIGQECVSDQECQDEWRCFEGRCAQVECVTNEHCDDGSLCTGLEVCDEFGRCQPGEPLSCPSSESPCLSSVCDAILGCVEESVTEEVACDDGDSDSPRSYCDEGVCVGCTYRTGPVGGNPVTSEWLHLSNLTLEEVITRLPDGWRLSEIDVVNESPLRLSVIMVPNLGENETAWWWYVGLNARELTDLINTHQARLLDIDAYVVDGALRFAVIMVENTGLGGRAWWYGYGTIEMISSLASENNARIVELDDYVMNGQQLYAAIMLDNSSANQRAWWHYYNLSIDDAISYAMTNRARIVSLVGLSSGNVSVVMEQSPGRWWAYASLSSVELSELTRRNGARLIDMKSYQVNGQNYYTAALVNHLNGPGERLSLSLRQNVNGGQLGAYLKRIGGQVLIDYNADQIFEPASSIKSLHLLTAMRRFQAGTLSLNELIPFCGEITGNSCPVSYDDCVAPEQRSMSSLARDMMVDSSNTATQAFRDYLSEAEINQVARDVGMLSTLTQHRIGCGSDPQGDFGLNTAHNQLTLRDIGILFESVASGEALSGNARDQFWLAMLSANSIFTNVIDEEGAAMGLSEERISLFKQRISGVVKGGGYDSIGKFYRSATGLVRVPFKCGDQIEHHEYVFGTFIDSADGFNGSEVSIWTSCAEVLRDEIREALSTW